jgi:hypothetical protein
MNPTTSPPGYKPYAGGPHDGTLWSDARGGVYEKITSTSTYRRTLALYQQQDGLCWICNFPMLPPRENCRNPNRVEATLDHLARRNSGYSPTCPRPAKAAHKWCNNVRGHNETVPSEHLRKMESLFGQASWFKTTFGAVKR